MAITDPFILATNVVMIDSEQLPLQMREQIGAGPSDYALSLRNSRMPSQVIDRDTVELLNEFKSAKPIVEGILSYSRTFNIEPMKLLDEAFPLLERFISQGVLVAAENAVEESNDPTLAIGTRVDGFEIVRCVHVVADSEIYQVKGDDDRVAALKILLPGAPANIGWMLKQERSILVRLDGHINPPLWGSGEHENRPYLITEWCPGTDCLTAAQELRRGGATACTALLKLCSTILAAYAHLHAQGVVHSDVHPRNVLVADDGSVRIIDFGLAHAETPDDALRSQRGGVAFFFEPEYAKAGLLNQQPPKSTFVGEQYSLAALLYLMLANRHYLNFRLEKVEMLGQIAAEDPLPLPSDGVTYPARVEAILRQALNKDPARRFASVADFADQWNAMASPAVQRVTGTELTPRPGHSAAAELLDTVLQRVGLEGPLLPYGLAVAPTCSVNYGAAGIALALYRIACVRDDASLLSLADIWASRAGSKVDLESSFYNGEMELTPQTVGRVSPYHTASGVYCVQALIGQAMGDLSSQQSALTAFIAASAGSCDELELALGLDLALGRAGTLLASSLMLDTIQDNAVLDRQPLLELGTTTLNLIWNKLDALAPIGECPEITYLGIAHGWAGLIYATLRWCQAANVCVPANVEERLAQLIALAESSGRGVHWAWLLNKQEPKPSGYMPGWCNGSAGHIHLWTLAYQRFRHEAYLTLAQQAAWNAYEERSSIGNLCCGLSGQAYGLLNLYHCTGERVWLQRGQELGDAAARMVLSASQHPQMQRLLPENSLYKGQVGVALLASELTRPELAAMPMFGH